MDAHGGKISVQSNGEGTGSSFTVELKLTAERNPRFSFRRNSIQPAEVRMGRSGGIVGITMRAASSFRNDFLINVHLFLRSIWYRIFHHASVNSSNRILEMSGEDVMDTKTHLNVSSHPKQRLEKENKENKENDEMLLNDMDERKKDDELYLTLSFETNHMERKLPSLHLKLLIVDDSHVCRNMLARSLVSRFRVCDEAEDGKQAVELMKASIAAVDPYDVVLMDFEMPHMNGSEAAKQMREVLGYGGVIIGLSGNELDQGTDDFIVQGADDVLMKPIKVHQLDDVLQHILIKKNRINNSYRY